MKAQDFLLIGGAVFIAYWLFKKKANIIDSKTDVFKPQAKEEPRTIVLDLRETPKRKYNSFKESVFVRDYDSSKFRTVAPPSVVVKNNFL